MGRVTGTAAAAYNFEAWKASPLDARTVVQFYADLTNAATWESTDGNEYTFIGMIVAVIQDAIIENNGVYLLKGKPFTDINNWTKLGSSSPTPDFDYNEAINKPTLNGIVIEGDKTSADYDIIMPTNLSEFVNDTEFITKAVSDLENYYRKDETYTQTEIDDLVAALNKVEVVYQDTVPVAPQEGVLYLVPDAVIPGRVNQWFMVGGVLTLIGNTDIDMTNFYNKAETDAKILELAPTLDTVTVNALPDVADAKTDMIYVSTADNTKYIFNGTFKPIGSSVTHTELVDLLDNKQDKLIAGENITIDDATNTISSTGGAGGTYTNLEPSVMPVGGISAGTTFENRTLTQMFDAMFYPELNPTLTNPSLSVSLNSTTAEVGLARTITVRASFDRGDINPAYGTSGNRAGLPNKYAYDGTDYPSTSLLFSQNVDITSNTEQVLTFAVRCHYDEGEQPKTSKGNDFGTPLVAGHIDGSATFRYIFPYFATTTTAGAMTKQPLASIGTYIEVNMVAETTTEKQKISYASIKNACTGVQVFNTISGAWEWLNGSRGNSLTSFTATTENRDINGVSQQYRLYTHNGVMVGARKLRFYI